MKKFKVLASSTCLFYAEIKAEDEASALQKAADLCESEFIEFDSDWKITEVIEQQKEVAA